MAKVDKQRKSKNYKENDYFVKRHGSILNLSSAVRDSILPSFYVRAEIDRSDIVLYPTDDVSEYKLSFCKGEYLRQAKICIYYMATLVNIPMGVRIPCIVQGDGSIRIKLCKEVDPCAEQNN